MRLLLLLFICTASVVKTFAQDKPFYFISTNQLFVPSKNLNKNNVVDKKSLKRLNEFVLLTVDLTSFTAQIEYLNTPSQNVELTLDKQNIEGGKNDNSFGFPIKDNAAYKTLHYIGGDNKLLSLERQNGDQLIFGEIDQVDVDDFMVAFIKKTGVVFYSPKRIELSAQQVRNPQATLKNPSKPIVEDVTITIDKYKKDISIEYSVHKEKNLKIKYTDISVGMLAGDKTVLFDYLDKSNISKLLISVTQNSFHIFYSDNSHIMFQNIEPL